MRNIPLIALVLSLNALFLNAAETPQGGSSASKYGPADVEVQLRDGSMLRGELSGITAFALKTPYGLLNIPLNRVVHFQMGVHIPPQNTTEVPAALKDLDSDDFNTRTRAQQKLEAIGLAALAALRAAKPGASAEARTRIDALLTKISAKSAKTSENDSILTDEFEALGQLQQTTLSLQSCLGPLQIKFEDVNRIRWLAKGDSASLSLDVSTALEDWIDTGIDSIPGEKMAVCATGTIKVYGNTTITPEGTTNWNSRPFKVGAVIGKLGVNNKPFLIGPGKQWSTDGKERLYLKIHCNDDILNNDNRNTSGAYSVQIGTSYQAENIHSVDNPDGQSGGERQPSVQFRR